MNQMNTLFLSKLEKSPQKERILTEINEEFTNVNKYFDVNTKMIIGHKPLHRADIVVEKKEFSYKPIRRFTRRNLRDLTQSKQPEKFDNYETVDNHRIKELFESFRSQTRNNWQEESKLPSLPKEVVSRLELQQKSLAQKLKDDSNKEKMGKYLVTKINKKESDLLINTIEKFRIKKEVTNTFHYKNSLEDKYDKQKWHISLRRPEHFKGARKIMINVSTDANPLWAIVKDKYLKKDKIYCYSNDLDEMEMNNRQKRKDLKQIQADIRTISSLRLNGKSLLQFEYEHALQMTKQKYIKKKGDPRDAHHNSNESNTTICEHYNVSNQKAALTMSSFNASNFNQTMLQTVRKSQELF